MPQFRLKLFKEFYGGKVKIATIQDACIDIGEARVLAKGIIAGDPDKSMIIYQKENEHFILKEEIRGC